MNVKELLGSDNQARLKELAKGMPLHIFSDSKLEKETNTFV